MKGNTLDKITEFQSERVENIKKMKNDNSLKKKSRDWMLHADKYKYTYNYSWLGRPIIKYPNDIVLLQEIIWDIKPDLIIETGIAHGGSIIFSASMLELIGNGEVLAIDIDIREHNLIEIKKHPLYKRITLLEGDSTSNKIVTDVYNIVENKNKIMVCLDSLHTHEHVKKELDIYSDMVSVDSYLILPDTFIEFFPEGYYDNRPWDVGNNPYTAMQEFLKENSNFIVDNERSDKLLITEALGGGYLKRIA